MKKILAFALTACMLIGLVACGNDTTETLTGKAEGFGGILTVEVTRKDGKIIDVKVVSHEETDGIGTPAIDALPAAIVEANGTEGVDMVADATVTSTAIINAVNNALDPEKYPFDEGTGGVTPPADLGPVGAIGPGLRLGQAQWAAHGEKCFTNTTVLIDGDKVVAAAINEYQFMAKDTVVGVPNADASFNENFANPEQTLVSKRVNNAVYSQNMAANGGATMELTAGWAAVEEFVVGKTIAELEAVVAKTDEDALAEVDAVASCTLVDARGYIQSVVEAARDAKAAEGLTFDGTVTNLKLGVVEAAAHGDKCFTVAAAVVDGDTIILSYIDEFQIMSGDVVGVPNSNGGFGEGITEGMMLVSKKVNNETYSKNMAEKGGATMLLSTGWDAVKAYVDGKTVAELTTLIAKDDETALAEIDAVASCTLVDARGYTEAILDAAKAAQ